MTSRLFLRTPEPLARGVFPKPAPRVYSLWKARLPPRVTLYRALFVPIAQTPLRRRMLASTPLTEPLLLKSLPKQTLLLSAIPPPKFMSTPLLARLLQGVSRSLRQPCRALLLE